MPSGAAGLLHSGFVRAARTSADRPALSVDGLTLTYGALAHQAEVLAASIVQRTPPGGSPLTGVFAHRSVTGFAGILGALLAGHGYVPLNRNFPIGRTRAMLQSADCRALVVDTASEAQLEALLDGVDTRLLILLPGRDDVSALAARLPRHLVLGARELEAPAASAPPVAVTPDAIAYLLFTSGSTGTPKGVMVSHRNAVHFVGTMAERYGISADDRFSQMFDTTFDLSVFDMFVAWERGAFLCCPPANALMNPDAFIRDMGLTVWLSVPSVGSFMKRLGLLKANRYPSLRWSLFCGEPLPADVAQAWAQAAPASVVENLYGPTELTVACSAYRWDPDRSPAECELGIVPIGWALPGMEAIVVDESLRDVPPGGVGELLMSGPQVTPGYWKNIAATERAYVRPPGRREVFYRTGDRVRRPVGDGPLTYVGRTDHQIKVLGHRVELGEVEAALREERGVAGAVAVGWPVTTSGADGVVAFLIGEDINAAAVRSAVAARLPPYAVPRAIHVLEELPRSANGKVDRTALVALLQA